MCIVPHEIHWNSTAQCSFGNPRNTAAAKIVSSNPTGRIYKHLTIPNVPRNSLVWTDIGHPCVKFAMLPSASIYIIYIIYICCWMLGRGNMIFLLSIRSPTQHDSCAETSDGGEANQHKPTIRCAASQTKSLVQWWHINMRGSCCRACAFESRGFTLQFGNVDVENWENVRTYYVGRSCYFGQFWWFEHPRWLHFGFGHPKNTICSVLVWHMSQFH